MNHTFLENLVTHIENLNSKHHIEILRIIKNKQPSIRITENNNGSFINMNDINEHVLVDINKYLEFNKNREQELEQHENIKNSIIEKNFVY